jgi:thiol-disulfide isomerase/thioredoxin
MFKGPNPDGVLISLEDRLGKITIIDFWASWCRPCRVENPSLVKLYQKYQYSGLSIVGVSLDKGKNQWLQAIADDGLIWDHVSNLKFWGEPIAKQYKVTQMPTTFVLDESKKIIGVDVKGDDLDAMIALQLSK